MKWLLMVALSVSVLPLGASALEIAAPRAPDYAADIMPEDTENLAQGILELLERVFLRLHPELEATCSVGIMLLVAMIGLSLLQTCAAPAKKMVLIAGTIMIAGKLIQNTGTLVELASETVWQLCDYGKLLWPVMTAAMAAQGAGVTSAALYAATAALDTLLTGAVSRLLVPLIYGYLGLSIGNCAWGDEALKGLKGLLKSLTTWGLKLCLTGYTAFLSLTGVVSGTTDAAALKAAKVTLSSVVPVVGGIMADASDAVLISAGMMKNAAGIYGILVIASIFVYPFLRIAIPYLILKLAAALGGIFAAKELSDLVEDFASAVGLLLAMVGASGLMLLVSVFCFMKGVGM